MDGDLELARGAAGNKNDGIWGGASIMREYLRAGQLDEMQIHLIPILLGGGVRLFEDLDPQGIELRRTTSIETPSATPLPTRSGCFSPSYRRRIKPPGSCTIRHPLDPPVRLNPSVSLDR